jgi:hypothetical protein
MNHKEIQRVRNENTLKILFHEKSGIKLPPIKRNLMGKSYYMGTYGSKWEYYWNMRTPYEVAVTDCQLLGIYPERVYGDSCVMQIQ